MAGLTSHFWFPAFSEVFYRFHSILFYDPQASVHVIFLSQSPYPLQAKVLASAKIWEWVSEGKAGCARVVELQPN